MIRALAILALAVLAPGAANAFTVTGRFLYEDRIYDAGGYSGEVQNLPIRRARVQIVDAVTMQVLASGHTDGGGVFALEVSGPLAPLSFYARCLADGRPAYQITVVDAVERDFLGGWVPPNAPLHAVTTETVVGHDPMSDHDFHDVLIDDPDGTGAAQAFNIFDCAVDFFDWIAQPGILGHLPLPGDSVSYSWGPNNANEGSNYTANTILISSPGQGNDTDGWSDTVILHETGHWFDDNFSRSDNPGGAHFLGDNDANVLLAYGEGAATYHCAKVREYRALARGVDDLVSLYADLQIPPAVGVPGGLSFSYDFETGNLGDGTPIGQIGSANETNVTSALWDLLDGTGTPDATPGADDDGVEVGDEVAWGIENAYLPLLPPGNAVTVEDYWQGWFARNGPGHLLPGLEHIFVTLARMPFRADGFEPDGAIGKPGSVTPLPHAVTPDGRVVINEIHLGPLDAVELYNGGSQPVALDGWQIEVYANDIAPGDPPTVYTFTPRTLDPGETVTLHEGGLPLDSGSHHVYAGDQQTFNAPWNHGIDGAVVLRDALGQALDFVKWRGVANGVPYDNDTPVPPGVAFAGSLDTPAAPDNLARDIHGTDTDDASDFAGHYGSLGSPNHPSPQVHTVFDAGDMDLIAFTAAPGVRYGFEALGPYSKSDPAITLLDAAGRELGGNDDVQASVRGARLDFYAGAGGDYYVRVHHAGAQTDYAEYQLLAFVRPVSAAFIPPSGLVATAENTTDTADAVRLAWVNAGAYDSVRVFRDGVRVATLPGAPAEYADHADRGLHRYEVAGILAGAETPRAGDDEFAGLVTCQALDDFESGNAGLWLRDGTWDVTPFAASGTWAFTDSPAGVYESCLTPGCGHMSTSAVFAVPADLVSGATLTFDQICITEHCSPPDPPCDAGVVEVSADDGTTWTEVARYDEASDPAWADRVAGPGDWRPASIDLSGYAGARVLVRLRLESDQLVGLDGWHVDNMRVGQSQCPLVAVGEAAVPRAFELLPPWPNPAHGPARLAWTLPGQEARVDIQIHDVAGRLVRLERLGARPAGTHSWTWDGRDGHGRAVASGAYFVRLLAGDRSEMRKLVKLAP